MMHKLIREVLTSLMIDRDKWLKSENAAANSFGKRIAFSGAHKMMKGDVMGEGAFKDYLVEHKFTEKKSYSLKLELLKKIALEALGEGRKALFSIDFGGNDQYIVLRKRDFMALVEND
jgi:hypothetical protein